MDAVDTVTAKIVLAVTAQEKNIPIISSMGAGNKLEDSQFRVADLYETKVCPLAKVMRREAWRSCWQWQDWTWMGKKRKVYVMGKTGSCRQWQDWTWRERQ